MTTDPILICALSLLQTDLTMKIMGDMENRQMSDLELRQQEIDELKRVSIISIRLYLNKYRYELLF